LWSQYGVCNWPTGAAEECAFYCGTGWRSAGMTLLALDLGASKPKNIDGGFFVYAMGPDAPEDPTVPQHALWAGHEISV